MCCCFPSPCPNKRGICLDRCESFYSPFRLCHLAPSHTKYPTTAYISGGLISPQTAQSSEDVFSCDFTRLDVHCSALVIVPWAAAMVLLACHRNPSRRFCVSAGMFTFTVTS